MVVLDLIPSHKRCSDHSTKNPENNVLLEFSEQLTNFVALLVFSHCCTIQFPLAAKNGNQHLLIELSQDGTEKRRAPVSGKVSGLLYLNF